MDVAKIELARRFMTGEDLLFGGEICASCGLPRANTPLHKAMGSTFNAIGLLLNQSPFICSQCVELFKDAAGRRSFLLYTEQGRQNIITREDVLPLIQSPPRGQFVFSVPYSFQKHHWLQAGLSTSDCAYIGIDSGAVEIDYKTHNVPQIVETARDAIECGLSRKEAVCGKYSVFSRHRFGGLLDELEKVLSPVRAGGLLDLIIRHIPAVKKKKSFTITDGGKMFSDTEQKAIAVVSTLAAASMYRKERGLDFWQSFFKRRIFRNIDYPLNVFFSGVSRGISCDIRYLDASLVESLSEEESSLVMNEIKQKTDLIIAAAYTAMQEDKPTTSKESTRKTKGTKKEADNGLQSLFV